jgi:hypothetical protein
VTELIALCAAALNACAPFVPLVEFALASVILTIRYPEQFTVGMM